MAYVDTNAVHNPSTGGVAPATWGDQVRDNFVDLDARTATATEVLTTNAGTTTSTSFTATLSGTPGTNPSVSITTGTAAWVFVGAAMVNSGAAEASVGFAVSGATTVAATDNRRIMMTGTSSMNFGRLFLVTGLTAGTNIFTLQYRVSAGTGTFANRSIAAWPANKLS